MASYRPRPSIDISSILLLLLLMVLYYRGVAILFTNHGYHQPRLLFLHLLKYHLIGMKRQYLSSNLN